MNKKDIKNTAEETFLNNIVKINNHLLKGYILNKEELKKDIIFYCKNYLNKKEVLK